MKKKSLLLFLLVIILSFNVFSQDINQESGDAIQNGNYVSYITLVDSQNNPLTNSLVRLKINVKNKDFNFELVSDKDGRIGIETSKDKVDLEIKLDMFDTAGKDFYARYEYPSGVPNGETINLFEIGSIRGVVLDKLDNVVSLAELQFKCDMALGEKPPEKSDKFGSFYYEYAPTGNCRVHAQYNDGVGFTDTNIQKGQVQEVIIKLDKTIVDYNNNYSWPWFFMVVIIMGLMTFGIIFYQTTKNNGQKPVSIKKESNENSRMKNIMPTLNFKEKNVVKYLLEINTEISQNDISRKVGIPKTSLCRVIESLLQKKIIEVESIGKFKKIKLSNWFLGK
jgi:hypothetical protein